MIYIRDVNKFAAGKYKTSASNGEEQTCYFNRNKSDTHFLSFILDVYVLLVKNLNPFSLRGKFSDKTTHEMVYMLRRECIPPDFYRYICEEKNFIYLDCRDIGQPGVLDIVGGFIDQ